MAITVAFAGKGGTGKTTITGMMIDWLCKAGKGPVLAVDADANSNLNEVLGVEVETTLGEIREIIAASDMDDNTPIPPSMSKKEYLDYKFNTALVEEDDFDLSQLTDELDDMDISFEENEVIEVSSQNPEEFFQEVEEVAEVEATEE